MFVASIFGYVIIVFINSVIWQICCVDAISNMHNAMADKVIRAKILFFDSNPIGRILSRFSVDCAQLDTRLAGFAMLATVGTLRALFVCISVVIVNPWSLIIVFVSIFYMIFVYKKGTLGMIEA